MSELSVRTRFEVFKRDRFTCQYCGRTPPTVLLECDHIVPRAAGGSDEMTNLTTACQECNRGKSSGLLEEGTAPVVGREVVAELEERIEQAKAYMELMTTREHINDEQVARVMEAWAKAYGAELTERSDGTYWVFTDDGQFPKERSVRSILKRLNLENVLDAVDITAGRIDSPGLDACRYFYGVCWRAIKNEEPTTARPHPQSDPAPVYLQEGVLASYKREVAFLLEVLSEQTGETTDDLWVWLQRELSERD